MPEGFESEAPELSADQHVLFEKWKTDGTGVPYIDAAMHELNATGFISNHNRQVVAVFLVDHLKVDWTKGAAYFEEKLIDYSPASNWGNWAFVAGVGNDTRDSRYFAGVKHADSLVTESDFVSAWLPELNDSDNNLVAV